MGKQACFGSHVWKSCLLFAAGVGNLVKATASTQKILSALHDMNVLVPSNCCESTGIHPSSQCFQVFFNCGFAVAQSAELKPSILNIRDVLESEGHAQRQEAQKVLGELGEREQDCSNSRDSECLPNSLTVS